MGISVGYDGKYPSACSGTLTITVDGDVLYEKQYCCRSTGSVWFDENWQENIEGGVLLWDDAAHFPQDIREAVEATLAAVGVCCGGCV